MSIIKFGREEWRKLEGALLCAFDNGAGGWDNPVRGAVMYSAKTARALANEYRHNEHEGKDPASAESIGRRAIRYAVDSWRVANSIAYSVQYNETFDPTERDDDDKQEPATCAGGTWIAQQLHSLRYNLATNGGRVFCPAEDVELLDSLIVTLDAHRIRDFEEDARRQREVAEGNAARAKVEEAERIAKQAERRAKREAGKAGGSVTP